MPTARHVVVALPLFECGEPMIPSEPNEPSAATSIGSIDPCAPRPAVLAVGPPLDVIGGMTSVIRQTLGFTYGGRYTIQHLPTTHAAGDAESIFDKLTRHRRQVGTLECAIRQAAASIVHVHTCSSFSFYRSLVDLLIARHLGCRVVLHVHGAAFDEFFDQSSAGRKRIVGWGLRRADRVIALSDTWRHRIAAMAPEARITVIENAIELPALPLDRRTRVGEQVCHFIMLARMDVWKGIDDALTAAGLLYKRGVPFRLTLAGPEGSAGDAATLTRKIESLGLSRCVSYVGSVEGQAKTRLLESADAYLMPSHHEGLPISVLEALAHGLPIVATSVGAIPEVIEDGVCGKLVAPRSPSQLADAMASLVNNPELRESMGESARRLAEARFGLDRFERDLIALYDGLLEKSVAGERILASATAPRSSGRRSSERTAAVLPE